MREGRARQKSCLVTARSSSLRRRQVSMRRISLLGRIRRPLPDWSKVPFLTVKTSVSHKWLQSGSVASFLTRLPPKHNDLVCSAEALSEDTCRASRAGLYRPADHGEKAPLGRGGGGEGGLGTESPGWGKSFSFQEPLGTCFHLELIKPR